MRTCRTNTMILTFRDKWQKLQKVGHLESINETSQLVVTRNLPNWRLVIYVPTLSIRIEGQIICHNHQFKSTTTYHHILSPTR